MLSDESTGLLKNSGELSGRFMHSCKSSRGFMHSSDASGRFVQSNESFGRVESEGKLYQSINHGGYTSGDALPHLLYGATPGGHASRISMQAPFPYQVTPSRRHRFAAAKSSVGVPLASSKSETTKTEKIR